MGTQRGQCIKRFARTVCYAYTVLAYSVLHLSYVSGLLLVQNMLTTLSKHVDVLAAKPAEFDGRKGSVEAQVPPARRAY